MGGLFHAWHEWLAGHDTRDLIVLGMPGFWWDRLAKGLQMFGALVVVVDLVGRKRIEEFRDELSKHRLDLTPLLKHGKLPTLKAVKSMSVWISLFLLNTVMALACFSASITALWSARGGSVVVFYVLFIFGVLNAVAAALTALIWLTVGAVGIGLAVLAIPLGGCDSAESLGTNLKWYGFWAVLIGSALDLLAS
jgi:hypothetical protein